jgi:hypothetical protein
MKTNKKSLTVAVAFALTAGVALAQTGPVRPAYSFPTSPDGKGPGGVRLGDSPVYATPFATLNYGNDSNVTLRPSNEIDSAYQVYGGGVKLDARDERSVFQYKLDALYGRYSDSTEDNYSDWGSRLSYDFAFDTRNFARLSWDYIRGHDGRGTTDRFPPQTSPDKYFTNTPGFVYSYGAPGAQGRAEVFGSLAYKRYLNNRDVTAGSDLDTRNYGAAFYWRVAPKTSLLAEARGTDLNYKLSTSTLSGNEARYYGGVTWEATAATTGTIKVGYLEKSYDSSRPTFTGTSWEGMVSWLPRTYSKFDLYSSRQPRESSGLGDFILSDATGIVWTHGWNSVISTDANASFTKDRYKGFDRTDDIQSYGIRASYKMRRWLTLGAEYQYTKRDSTQNFNDYDKNLWLISAILSM